MPESKRFLLRLDPKLFEALRRWAADDLRSINAQIEYLLTDQARRAGRLTYQRTRRPPMPVEIEPVPDEFEEGEGEAAEFEEGEGEAAEEAEDEAASAPARRR